MGPSPRVLPLLVICGLAVGCDDKTNAQKMADQAASAKASASAAAAASASEVDPKEMKYAAARKALKERATAHMTALEKLYLGASDADKTAYRAFFVDGADGDKAAEQVTKEALTAAKDTKMKLKKWEIGELTVDPTTLATGTTEVTVEEDQKGKSRCTFYKLDWKLSGATTWQRTALRDFRVVACDAAPK